MRTADQHATDALALAPPPVAVDVPVTDAWGLVLASDVVARVDSPPFDNSAMDGFAVRWADVAAASGHGPVTLAITGESRAGAPSPAPVAEGIAVRIMTGAAMPEGADTVVPVEATCERSGTVEVLETRAEGSHVRRRGEDVRSGDVVIVAGTALAARHLAAAATVGADRVSVYRRPRVGILSTGDELVALGAALGAGHIYESNSHVLAGAVRGAGGEPVVLSPVGDDVDDVVSALTGAGVDLLITTGGVSVGDYDVVKAALAGLGVEFLSVAMQPGKPQGLGMVDGTPVLCFPGNPVSVAVSFELFALPVIRAMRGLDPRLEWEAVTVGEGWKSPEGREQFMPVRFATQRSATQRSATQGFVTQGSQGEAVTPATAGGAGSHLMASLARADGLARVPAATTEVRAGDSLVARRFTG